MQKVTPEHVRWAYRLFLDREPENDAVLVPSAADTIELRRGFLYSAEFQQKNPDTALDIDKWVILPTDLGFRIFIALNELGVSRPILLGEYEPDALKLFQSIIGRGDRVIDIGANIGFFSLLFATLVGDTGEVLAFEPIPYLYEALGASIEENNFQDRCRAYRCALSDENGTALIRHARRTLNFGGGHLTDTPRDDGHQYDRIETRLLSEFISERRCRLLKIDVEGAEPKVIAGGIELLQRDRPVVMAELFNRQLHLVSASNATELIGTMAKLRYHCHEISDGKVGAQIQRYDSDELTNVVFVPQE